MVKYLRVVKGILTQFDKWYAEHIPREENTTADALSQCASSEIENSPRSIYFPILKTPTIHVINLIAPVGVASCWINPIKTHLETGWLLDETQEARKLSVRALRYSLIEGLLYKRYQRHAPIVRQPPERLTSISTPIPFAVWEMDILEPFPIASGLRKFIVVAIDYFTKEYCDDNSIEPRFTSIAHPQANGQAEVANMIILDGLKKRVERSRNTWEDELLPILWAYCTTCKGTTEATPFMLAYRAEAVVPLEITHGPPRVEAYEPKANEEGIRLALDLIDDVK
ncbi:uncharacterized protein LOC141673189 [Apium graveolens]|uniref:uncharacterized protein LOC141673189 n=1 Tax=Apium graveolens TaxID=4045 RepID=UPI003D7C0155